MDSSSDWTDKLLNSVYRKVRDEMEKSGKHATYDNYQYSLSLFLSYLDSLGVPTTRGLRTRFFSEETLTGFYHWLLEGRELSSCKTIFANVRALLKRISSKEITLTHLYENACLVKTGRINNVDDAILEDEDLASLIRAPGMDTSMGIRYTCLFALLATSGVRISESLSIRIRDLDIDGVDSYARIVGKGNRVRIVPIAKQVVPLLLEYIGRWHGETPLLDSYLFFSPRYGPNEMASRAGVHKQLKRYSTIALGEEKAKKVHLHLLRHTAATKWFENNMNYAQVSKILGHAGLRITKRYVRISGRMMRNNIKKSTLGIRSKKRLNIGQKGKLSKYEELFTTFKSDK